MCLSRLRPNPTKIFISYRRDESSADAGRLSDYLSARFDPRLVFMDRESIEPGLDFVDAIGAAVNSCKVLLAVIGPGWVTCVDEGGRRRLDDPEDFVVLEIATALRRNVRVIPVLVGGASMPTKASLPADIALLARRQAWVVSDAHWRADVENLIKKIAGDIKRRRYLVALSILVLLAGLALVVLSLGGFISSSFVPSRRLDAPTSPSPAASPTPSPTASGGGQSQASPTPSPTPRPSASPKPTRRPAPPKNQVPEGNCNQRDYYNGLCGPEREENK